MGDQLSSTSSGEMKVCCEGHARLFFFAPKLSFCFAELLLRSASQNRFGRFEGIYSYEAAVRKYGSEVE
jgi:hypothetical protein